MSDLSELLAGFWCIALTAWVIFVVLFFRRNERYNQFFSRLAKQYQGKFRESSFFLGHLPQVRLDHRGERVYVRLNRSGIFGQKISTVFTFPWGNAQLRCMLHRHRRGSWAKQMLARDHVQVAQPGFNQRFRILGNNHVQIRELLDPGVQRELLVLDRLLHHSWFELSIIDGQMIIEKAGAYANYQHLVWLMQTVLKLYDHATSAQLAGPDEVRILEGEEVTPELPVCRICGEAIGEELVYCSHCRTPHHRDCWEYNGSCSVYGCGEVIYREPPDTQPNETTPSP
ncbi:Hypothetical protein PBC10988_10330 [Planctomycetales bacterium 10988]|nr:Hypothetical protein PBC10988_10330 [Planctomycetales bacterium 10988]